MKTIETNFKASDFHIRKNAFYVAIAKYKFSCLTRKTLKNIVVCREDNFYFYIMTDDFLSSYDVLYYWDKYNLKTKKYPKPNFDFLKE